MNHLELRIRERFPQEDISVLIYNTMKTPATVKCNTCGTEYSLTTGENFIRSSKTCICKKCKNNHSGGRLDIQNFQDKINKLYPDENLTVLEYTLKNRPCSIKCNNCGEIYTLKNAESFYRTDKKRICSKCIPNKCNQMRQTVQNFQNWIKIQNQFIFEDLPTNIRSDTLIQATCQKCGAITKKLIYDYLKGKGCTYCQHNYLKTKEEYQQELGEEYLVLEYGGMNHRSKFKHMLCGFIYESSTRGYNCPKCHGSKGEKTIRNWLLQHFINFEEQKQYNIDNHILRVDFYLPDNDLIIEYQGIQHFQPIDYFGGKRQFQKQQHYDNLKRQYFQNKMVEISYEDYKNIEKILNDLNLKSSSTILNGVEDQIKLNLEADTMINI